MSSTFLTTVLRALDISSFEELSKMDPDEVVRRMDSKNPPVHAADAFFAVMVVSGLVELRKTTVALDDARKGFDRATIVVAVLGLIVAVLGLDVIGL